MFDFLISGINGDKLDLLPVICYDELSLVTEAEHMDELEIVQYQQVSGLSVFVNTITYRSAHFHKDWELLWVLDAPPPSAS